VALPASFLRDGFVEPAQLRKSAKRRRLLIGSDGKSDTGKTEFACSAPGPGIVICLDRGFDAMLDNATPPKTRRTDFAFKVITAPTATQASQNTYVEYWRAFYSVYVKALENPEAVTVVLDGDSDSWELQRLAEHGRLTGIFPQTRYSDVYAARRAMINRAWDAGKIVIATNKVKTEYRTVRDRDGNVVLDPKTGEEKREKTGDVERQGFPDQEYLWQIQLRHLYQPARINPLTKKLIPQQWGIRITKCKVNTGLVGTELWGSDCHFQGLVQLVYPHIPLSEWGF